MIRLIVADDMSAHRKRIKRALKNENDIEIIAETENGYETVMKTMQLKPDIVLMDVEMESKDSGISASKEINKILPQVKIIILTSHTEDEIVYAAFQSGIVDYISKDSEDIKIIDVIKNAYEVSSPMQPIIAEKIRKEFKKMKDQEENILYLIRLISELTPSEFSILRLLIQGKNRTEISHLRFVEIGTLKKQINSLLKKCNRSSTKELISDLKTMNIIQMMDKI